MKVKLIACDRHGEADVRPAVGRVGVQRAGTPVAWIDTCAACLDVLAEAVRPPVEHAQPRKRRAKEKLSARDERSIVRAARFVKQHPDGVRTGRVHKECWPGVGQWTVMKNVRLMKARGLVHARGRKLFPGAA